MPYWMSRPNYERCRAEQAEADRPQFEATFAAYPDDLYDEPWHVDQDRIAARLAELQHQEPPAPSGPLFTEVHIWHWPKGNGKASAAPPPPWEPTGPGVWSAPAGTPMPGANWVSVFELLAEIQAEERADQMRRYLLDNTVTTRIPAAPPEPRPWGDPDSDPLEDIKSWMRLFPQADPPPPARRLHAGDAAIAAISAAVPSAQPRPAWQSGGLGPLTGIPIVRDQDLPSNAWELRDARTGEVLDEGTCGVSVEECQRVVDEYLDQLAEEAEIPRHLFM